MCALRRGGGANFECCVFKQQPTNPNRYAFKTLFSSEFSLMALIVTVLWYVLKPPGYYLAFSMFICTDTIFSNILLMNGGLDIGL